MGIKLESVDDLPDARFRSELDEWRHLVALHPDRFLYRLELARRLARAGGYREALDQCRTCLGIIPQTGALNVGRRLRVVALSVRIRRLHQKRIFR